MPSFYARGLELHGLEVLSADLSMNSISPELNHGLLTYYGVRNPSVNKPRPTQRIISGIFGRLDVNGFLSMKPRTPGQ